MTDPFPYVYRWHRMGRKGQRCAVPVRGTMNSCLVQFEDGYTMVTSRNAIMRAPATQAEQEQDVRRKCESLP